MKIGVFGHSFSHEPFPKTEAPLGPANSYSNHRVRGLEQLRTNTV